MGSLNPLKDLINNFPKTYNRQNEKYILAERKVHVLDITKVSIRLRLN
jgi:hypothetical protein